MLAAARSESSAWPSPTRPRRSAPSGCNSCTPRLAVSLPQASTSSQSSSKRSRPNRRKPTASWTACSLRLLPSSDPPSRLGLRLPTAISTPRRVRDRRADGVQRLDHRGTKANHRGPNLEDQARSSFGRHDGDPCPRDSDADVLVIRRRIVMEGTPDFATGKSAEFDCDWSDDDPDYDVVSYRLIAAGTVTLAT